MAARISLEASFRRLKAIQYLYANAFEPMQDDLNKITLGPELLHAFYAEQLTLLSSQSAKQKKESDDVQDLGAGVTKNKKNITLLYTAQSRKSSGKAQLDFIQKILQACKLTLEDVALLPVPDEGITIEQLKASYQPAILVMFGLDPTSIGLPIRFPEFKLQSYDGTTYLAAPEIALLMEDTENGKLLKSRLWACLRSLFNL
jgi:hypothetical protein